MSLGKQPHLLHIFPTFGAGGIELLMAAVLNGIGTTLRHTIVALNGNRSAGQTLDPALGVEFRDAPAGWGSPFFSIALRKFIQDIRPDLLLTYNWGSIDAVIGAGILPVCPILHTECGFGTDEVRALKRRRVFLRRLVLRRAFRVMTMSHYLENIAIHRYGLSRDKVVYMPTGIDLSRFSPRKNKEWRKKLRIPDDDLVYGFVGGLRPEKNLEFLMRAFVEARLSRVKLVLIGEGAMRTELVRVAEELGLGDNVVFAGFSPNPAEALASCDVFVMSSVTEQTPVAIIEAMAMGLPVICTNVGDCAEILGTSEPPAVLPSGDLHAYSKSLRAFGLDPDLRAKWGIDNRQRAEAFFSMEGMVKAYRDLYALALGIAPQELEEYRCSRN